MNNKDVVSVVAALSAWYKLREVSKAFSNHYTYHKIVTSWDRFPSDYDPQKWYHPRIGPGLNPSFRVEVWSDPNRCVVCEQDSLGEFKKYLLKDNVITGICVMRSSQGIDNMSIHWSVSKPYKIHIPKEIAKQWKIADDTRGMKYIVMGVANGTLEWVIAERHTGGRVVLPLQYDYILGESKQLQPQVDEYRSWVMNSIILEDSWVLTEEQPLTWDNLCDPKW